MRNKFFTLLLAVLVIAVMGSAVAFATGEEDAEFTKGQVKGFRALSSHNSVVLKWKKNKNVSSYAIKWWTKDKKGNVDKSGWKKVKKGTDTYVHNKVDQDTTYYYEIYGVSDDGTKSPASDVIEGESVRCLRLQVESKQNVTLWTHPEKDHLPKVKYKVKKGEKIVTSGWDGGRYVFQKTVKGKLRTFYIRRIRTNTRKAKVYQIHKVKGKKLAKTKYTPEEAELYVNSRKIKSRTKKLIWINQYTERLYTFKRVGGKWKCENGPWEIASGKATTPTFVGVTSIKYKDYANRVSTCNFFSIHKNAPKAWGGLGWPKSNGCARNYKKNSDWILYKCKIGTAVVVF